MSLCASERRRDITASRKLDWVPISAYNWLYGSKGNSHSLGSDDEFRSGCRNVSHRYRHQTFAGLQSRSNYTFT